MSGVSLPAKPATIGLGILGGGLLGSLLGTGGAAAGEALGGIQGAIKKGTGIIGGTAHSIVSALEPSTPSLNAPSTQQPTQASASTTVIQSELAKEQNARVSATNLTGPSGLTDEPNTSPSLLWGS